MYCKRNSLCASAYSHTKRKGVVINETSVLLYAQLLTGRKYVISPSGQVHLEKQWAKQVLPFAHQTIVKVILQKQQQIMKCGFFFFIIT